MRGVDSRSALGMGGTAADGPAPSHVDGGAAAHGPGPVAHAGLEAAVGEELDVDRFTADGHKDPGGLRAPACPERPGSPARAG